MSALKLNAPEFSKEDLHQPAGLKRLFEKFRHDLKSAAPGLFERYESYLAGAQLSPVAESNLLVEVAAPVSDFIVRLFGIEKEVAALRREELALQPVYLFKRDFVQRRTLKKFTAEQVAALSLAGLSKQVAAIVKTPRFAAEPEETLAGFVLPLLEIEKLQKAGKAIAAADEKRLEVLPVIEQYVAKLYFSTRHLAHHHDWASFHTPKKIDNFEALVDIERPDAAFPEKIKGPDTRLRRRDGFDLTDKRMNLKESMDEVDYCIYCHDREKDSCAKGLIDKKTGAVQKNALGIKLGGCPLDEKISEAHALRKQGDSIGSLALVIIDNPMVPGTGHRICNDCMKSCIFQKQEPVNIPQIETNTLTRVLALPYGFEIYSLLTRWNPLNRRRPYALPYNGKNILVVGMGPAGYTLAHYLLNEGFGVVGIDGLKIEPLPESLVGQPGGVPPVVKDIGSVYEKLDQRILAGFGGVAEYGITVRWDKNFLKVIYLTLTRREKFRVYGGVRFGGTITIEDAWNLGFSHIAMSTGAGKPTLVRMKNNLIRGVRKASDFLMALQLTGAFKRSAFANLQIQLPAVVIGGGLTAIDTATEIMAYYPLQVEKVLHRYEVLSQEFGEDRLLARASEEDKGILKTFCEHGRAVRAERERAAKEGSAPNFVPLMRSWGGVSICYRKRMVDCPAYRLNHEEVIKALEEGIYFIENMNPAECVRDQFGALSGMKFLRQVRDAEGGFKDSGEVVDIPAKSLCVAAGTSPNIIYEKERPGTFKMGEKSHFFQTYFEDHGELKPSTPEQPGFLTSYNNEDGRRISFYGDNHPGFAGNVVKAMASAQKGYPQVVALFKRDLATLKDTDQPQREAAFTKFAQNLDDQLIVTVHDVVRLTPTIVDVIVRAPMAARAFEPGQFYRLQNYEADAVTIDGTRLMMEGIALTGAWTDKDKGLLSMIVLEMGTSSRLCASLKKGQRVVAMGPTGTPTEIPHHQTVILAGGGLGNAVLFSIAKAIKNNGNKVIYFAGYKDGRDVFKRSEIEAGTDLVIWSNDAGPQIQPNRLQDRTFTGNVVQAMIAYEEGKLGDVPISLKTADRIIAIGSDRMMNGVREARKTVLRPYLRDDHVAIGSINSSMQCMMKQVCAQCLQKHVDPVTGKETEPVYSCFNQDQRLDEVDFKNLSERLQMNHLQELMSNLWLDHLLASEKIPMV